VGTAAHPDRDPTARQARTLGDLLYADTTRALVSEKDWVGLVRAVAAGDQRALRTLYERAHRLVYTLSVRITNNRHAAEEVTVDVFHDVWRRAATYDPAAGTVVGWIMNQARSRAIDRLRFEQRKKRVNESGESPLPAVADHDPLEALDVREQGRRLREALTVLTPDERRTIEAAFFSELTYSEVATHLQQPLGTVKTRVRSGLAKLRRALGISKAS
jgi:RNA polymerase sigma-70 factor, ECF subfamily